MPAPVIVAAGAIAAREIAKRALIPAAKAGLKLAKKYGPKVFRAGKKQAKKAWEWLRKKWNDAKKRFSKKKKACEPCKQPSAGKTKNPYKKRSRSQNEKAANREKELIKEHEKKLDDYTRNPEKYDNKGTYRNAPNEKIKKKIYEGRKKALEKQIEKHKKELKKIEEAMKDD